MPDSGDYDITGTKHTRVIKRKGSDDKYLLEEKIMGATSDPLLFSSDQIHARKDIEDKRLHIIEAK